MDSGNSGSLQSSSGGVGGGGGGGSGAAATAADEDYDSRTDSISSFLNHSSSHFNHNPILQPPPSSSSSHHHRTLDTTFFNPSSASYFAPSNSTNPNPVYDPVWSRNVRPDPTFTGFGATQNDDVYLNSQQGMYANQSPPVSSNANPGRVSDHHQVGVTTKNPKKRTRASRRAPTTVLTTDTTNFRQMVQEFTGIPTAPFSASSSSPFSRRLDLFGGGGIGPLYPVRPSPQKIQLQQQPSISSVDASSSNYQLPPSDIQSFQKQPQTLLTSQNPVFSFQSLLQTKIPQQANSPILGTTKSDNQQSDLLSGFPSSSTRWRDQNENLVNFSGGNHNNPKVDGYKLNSLDFDHQTEKGLENVSSSRNGGDQTQGNVDSWLCPSD
ncbi:uncharacterized protein LOC112510858 [Cynara cardunculus var. scolymus]|uniref:uncharacterized protein LOC112510858 n=1 Tax=Cynara cardunculus var. scolymus TaxID=59895 RepID=UPI000D623217|nr:uncharacterized protein LOC112510858 [Cynara cardunculus var. scolymus]